jgi:serine/threonine protein kinase
VEWECRLCGFPPFYSENNEELFEIIQKGEFEFPSPHWDVISDMAKDLIKHILVVDPTQRYDGDQILAHPWVIGEKTPRKDLPQVMKKIREFNAKRKFRVPSVLTC